MSKRRGTFSVSPTRRPVHSRLTPFAWAMIAVLGLAVVLGIAWAVLNLTGRQTEAWQPTPTATPLPTSTPMPTEGPTPTAWYEGMISPTPEPTSTPEPTPAFSAWWSTQMTQEENGLWVAPAEVREMVIQTYVRCADEYNSFFSTGAPVDFDAIREWAPTCYSGEFLTGQLVMADNQESGISDVFYGESDECVYEAQDWSADGLEVTFSAACANVTISTVDPETGDVVAQSNVVHTGLALIRMIYDVNSGRWTQDYVVEYIPMGE